MNQAWWRQLGLWCVTLALLACCCPFTWMAPQLKTLFDATATPSAAGVSSSITQKRAALHQRVYERICALVREQYVYSDYNGVDWKAVEAEFAPRVAETQTDEEFWWLMYEMIERLNDDHSIYLTPEEVAYEEDARVGTAAYVGIGVHIVYPDAGHPYVVVQYTHANSPAERGGIRAHDHLLEADGQPLCCNPDGSDNSDLLLGEVGSTVRVKFQRPGQPPQEVTLERAEILSAATITARRLQTERGGVGYVFISSLLDEDVAERTRALLESLFAEGPVDGLILDLRFNDGGAFTELEALLALFFEGEIGHFFERGAERHDVVIAGDILVPQGAEADYPLVILVGPDTVSYAEVFSGGLQAVGRATLIGQPTAGNVETIRPYDMDDGSRLWLAVQTFAPVNGARWESVGVQPDILIEGHWGDFTEESDPAIRAALEVIYQE